MKNYSDESTVKQVFKSTRKKATVGIAIGVALIIGASLIVASQNKSTSNTSTVSSQDFSDANQPDTSEAKPISITATDLYNEYKQNEARADAKYKDKSLYISGNVSEIHKVSASLTTVSLAVGDELGLGDVECDLDSSDATLQNIATGDKIILIGKVDGDGLTGDAVQLKDGCSISK